MAAWRSATGNRIMATSGEQLLSESGDILGWNGYALQDMQVYRVTGVLKRPREAFKAITLEAIKTPVAKVG